MSRGMRTRLGRVIPTSLAAVFYLFPNLCPFLPPSEWSLAMGASFLRQVRFFVNHRGFEKEPE